MKFESLVTSIKKQHCSPTRMWFAFVCVFAINFFGDYYRLESKSLFTSAKNCGNFCSQVEIDLSNSRAQFFHGPKSNQTL